MDHNSELTNEEKGDLDKFGETENGISDFDLQELRKSHLRFLITQRGVSIKSS